LALQRFTTRGTPSVCRRGFAGRILQGLTRCADPQVVAIGDENKVMRWTLPHLTAFAAACAAMLFSTPWLHAADGEKMQQAAQRQGVKATAGVKALQTLMLAVSDLDEDGRLQAVNQFYNRRIQFRDDSEVWGQSLGALGKGTR
jgi:hypothetical protein